MRYAKGCGGCKRVRLKELLADERARVIQSTPCCGVNMKIAYEMQFHPPHPTSEAMAKGGEPC